MIDEDQRQPHFKQTAAIAKKAGLAALLLIIAVIATAGLDTVSLLGFPADFFTAAMLVFLLMPVLIYWFAARQNTVDRQYGASDEF